jgi:predicted PurR-regulated permease PerM
VTILVLAFLMVLEGPRILRNFFAMLEPKQANRFRRVAEDCAKAVTGYMAGNLLISAVAGSVSFIFLMIASVPFSGVLALWVAFADLIPLVGATLGAVPAVAVAFLHSTTAGVLTIIFFIAYQQFENHVLQVTVMSKTVDLNPLAVLVSVLVGVELAGIFGALLAIPAAGIIQVVARDIYDERRGRLKSEPTVGEAEVPVSTVERGERARATKKTAVEKVATAKKSAASKKSTKKSAAEKVAAQKA